MKKTLLWLVSLCLVCALVACKGDNTVSESDSKELSFVPESSAEESKADNSPALSEDISTENSEEISEDVSQELSSPAEKVTHRDPFWTNNGNEVTVHPRFPQPEDFEISSATRRQGFSDLFLVTKIDEYGFYGAVQTQFEAHTYIWGSYPQIKAGDYVFVSCSSSYMCELPGEYFNDYFHYVFAEAVTECKVVADEDLGEYLLAAPEKPVIYLYPTEETTVSVKLDYNGQLTCTYPLYQDGKGWANLTVSPDGTIRKDGKEYYCLYWEGVGPANYDFSKGFCVKGKDSAAFLETVLAEMGLTAREAGEFIIYWLPKLESNPYNVISFQTDAYTSTALLEVTPVPDSMLRVFMAYYPSDEYAEMVPQEFEAFERNGFSVVEWGGSAVLPVE